jgi:hypothetical protein
MAQAPCPQVAQRPQKELDAEAEADRRLTELAYSGRGDPLVEARRAIRRADFRMFGYSPAPGYDPRAHGVECRPGLGFADRALLRSAHIGNDILGTPGEMEERAAASQAHRRFGTRFNAALLASERNPLRDMCRLAQEPASAADPRPPGLSVAPKRPDPSTWGFRDLVETTEPLDLGEAARKGTPASLRRMIADGPDRLNDADTFRMTPLAWAVAYRREDAALALLAAGAEPAGAACGRADSPVAPVMIARELGWTELVEAMLAQMTRRQITELEEPPQRGPVSPEAINTLERLAERHSGELKQRRISIVAAVRVDASGTSRSCVLRSGTGVPGIDDELCRVIAATHRWAPARNPLGQPVDGEGIVRMAIVNRDPS